MKINYEKCIEENCNHLKYKGKPYCRKHLREQRERKELLRSITKDGER